MQMTFTQLDVPHAVIISLHVLIMEHVSKLYKTASFQKEAMRTQVALFFFMK